MDSFLPRGGFQLPFQRSISRLYNDTKKSSDFVKEPVQNEEDPEIKALHRKLRIQKDRLVSWGLEWSDPTQSAEIDESLSKAGLGEVVTSVMSTIKDILAEAEPLWLSSKHMAEGGSRPSPDRKVPLVQWDRGRFEDLVRDLTASIDTLYDLSRTRASGVTMLRRTSKLAFKTASSAEDTKPFESTRMQAPQQIDPQSLTHIRPLQPSSANVPRQVVFMSKTTYSQLTQGTSRQPWAPLLLEYATFDSIFSVTGIMPPMARFEKLSTALQQDPQRAPSAWTGLPRLFGYFEDMENSRIGLVYRFPSSFNAVSFDRMTQNTLYHLPSLQDLLVNPASEPPLEAKFRLAHNLANTVDIRRPLVSSFDLFPDDASPPGSILYRHPLDPRTTLTSPLANAIDERVLELHSLAIILLSIGLWTEPEALLSSDASGTISQSLLNQLTVRCGSLYTKAVETCWGAVDEELAGRASGDILLTTVQVRASRFLEACCILDGMSEVEERLKQETAVTEPSKVELPKDVKAAMPPTAPSGGTKKSAALSDVTSKTIEKGETETDAEDATSKPTKSEAKIRLYPQVPLPPEAVEKWNKILMPQINHALRHFYRKNPESVEISLESVGPSPSKTQPTVLVVCTSVGKVRAILKKRLGELFDGSTGFALKVCRGHVLRSRRQPQSVARSMARRNRLAGAHTKRSADDGEVEPVNPEYQERPGNGASIGAWIGDRHLPPVSFGGLVVIDDKPYGMTVHHMLDDPDHELGPEDTTRSSGVPDFDWYAESAGDTEDDDYYQELSDAESEAYSETDITSDYDDDDDDNDDDEEYSEPGDIPGIEPGSSDGYIVTQPALDDVEEGFYPCAETEAEDHLDSFSLGKVYASSGIRRKTADGLVHEVDWALFQFSEERQPDNNVIPRAQDDATGAQKKQHMKDSKAILRPTTVAASSSLPGLEVQCVARTSGLQTGQILPALTSVKIYGRASPSHTYQIASVFSEGDRSSSRCPPMGIPGDSGAWVIDRRQGQLCGHVLAWSQRKRVAYICPMDVLLLDIAETLEASEVRLPGGDIIVSLGDAEQCAPEEEGAAAEGCEESTPTGMPARPREACAASSRSEATSPMALDSSEQIISMTNRLKDMNVSGHRIDVTG
ncbi:hypothetical protein B0I35DRAFT_420429 [Stachybotrys elegans]|uniref:Uncharacterized protein n=1 Tax=Stachybotrys elegans TaxID=80388 RepID=A0A8K0T3L5_9HYPO|nr:hypothetical protein B0I35DRAFT_420429 [Stachybotrys elegans]